MILPRMFGDRRLTRKGKVLKSHFVAVAMLVLALSACAKDRSFEAGPDLQLVESSSLPPPVGALDAQGRPQVLIGPFDRLVITVFRATDFNRSVDVDGAGSITLPLIGTMSAAGLSPSQLAENIENQLRRQYLRDPQVAVQIEKSASQKVVVEGEVEKPGIYPITSTSTLLEAIATAEGTTEYSRLEEVVIFRTVGERKMAALYNLDQVRRGTYPNPIVYAGDVIVVGDSPARRRFKDLIAGSTLLTTPIIALVNTL